MFGLAMTPPFAPDPFFALRDRAYEMADSARFKSWAEIAAALRTEGAEDALVRRFDGDRLAVMMITRCCDQARASI